MVRRKPDLKYLFDPRSIAVIGASRHKAKIGYQLIDNIRSSKYPGKIYPVNPAGGRILGLPVYPSLDKIKGEIDLACITIPAQYVFSAVEACGRKNVKFLVIITSGFSEIGNLKEEREIADYAGAHGMRVLGPNIFGIYSSIAPINATFGPKEIKPGNVAIVTQSGALGVAMIGKTKLEGIGLSAIISIGNKSDIDEADVLEYLVAHKQTKVIMVYMEGIKHGARLVEVLKPATARKPVIVIKAGRSRRGAMAAASHTGSLAGADEIFSDIMKQCGVIRAQSIEEALNWCKFLAQAPLPRGENAVIITNGGGLGVMAADACEKDRVRLYDDITTLGKIFSRVVPAFGSTKNPVDLTAQASVTDYQKALEAALANRDIHAILCLGCLTASFDIQKLFAAIKQVMARSSSPKPLVISLFGEARFEDYQTHDLAVFPDVYDAVSCFGAMYQNYRNRKYNRANIIAQREFESFRIDTTVIERVIRQARIEKRHFLLGYEAQAIMKAAGISFPRSRLARNIEEAVKSAEDIGYPVAMKIVSRDIVHKSDAGGVLLGLDNSNEIMDAYQTIIHSAKRHNPRARIQGVEVTRMVAVGTETIIGARRDISFGPLVMFGLGGIYVEVLKDVSFRALPLNRNEAISMISDIKAYPLLLGVRGEARRDINGIIDTVLKVSNILYQFKDISDIEINPLVVYEDGQGVKSLDARIILAKPEEVS